MCLLFIWSAERSNCNGLLRHFSFVIAKATLQLASERCTTTLRTHHPRTQSPRRVVPNVLLMPTGKLRHPVTFIVLVKAGDALEHEAVTTFGVKRGGY